MQTEKTLSSAAAKAGMDEKTARKYRRSEKQPSEGRREHDWRTRRDGFADEWDWVRAQLEVNTGLEAKTLFEELVRRSPGRYTDGQLRTLQRRVKVWRATEGPSKEVFFEQEHRPGELGQSDFTHMSELEVTIERQAFGHMVYHFVLPYSNWEWGTVCFSESFASLSEGLQNALWQLGGVPHAHRTDRLSAAVHQEIHPETFTRRYQGLLKHYGMEGRRIQAGKAHENGDVEQRHHRFKRAVDQALMLRGSRNFRSREEYTALLEKLFEELNAGRRARLAEEMKVLHRLPPNRLESYKRVRVKVGQGSMIRVDHNVYSVHSRLMGEEVEARVHAEELHVWYGQRCVERLPRLRGQGKHRIDYRHVIDSLVRKPGAFEGYRYRDALFPTSRFRMAYDSMKKSLSAPHASREYLQILKLAAHDSEAEVDAALSQLVERGEAIRFERVASAIRSGRPVTCPREIQIAPVDLESYDALLESKEVLSC